MMRTRSFALLVGAGLLLSLGSVLIALTPQESTAAPVYKLVLAGISGDDSSGRTYSTPAANPTASATAAPTASATPGPGSCSYDRVAVKTLSDAGAAFYRAESGTSVSLLNSMSRPAAIPAARLPPAETGIYGVNAELISVQLNASRELVLLVSEVGSTRSMLVYFPHKDCNKGAPVADQVAMNLARTALTTACGEANVFSPKLLQGRATIKGAGFWGSKDSQGAAANGLELHPVTSFAYTATVPCDPNGGGPPPPPPTPTPAVVLQYLSTSAAPMFNKPGDAVTLTVQTVPVIPDLACEMRYYAPTDDIPFFPTLTAMTKTNELGMASWTFNIPAVTPLGHSQVEGRCDSRSGSTFIWVQAS